MRGILEKKCTKCLVVRDINCFLTRRGSRDGFRNQCKPCQNAAARLTRKTSPAHGKRCQEYYIKNKDKIKKYQKEYRQKMKPEERDRFFKREYGISLEDYEEMAREQENKCKICGKHEEENGGRKLALDHCHNTEIIRGLLCNTCNIGIGHFQDSPKLLREAAEYLEKNSNIVFTTPTNS